MKVYSPQSILTSLPLFFSGVNRRVFYALPYTDRSPYLVAGWINVVIVFLFGFSGYLVIDHESFLNGKNKAVLFPFLLIFVLILVSIIQILVTLWMFNSNRAFARFLFLSFGMLVSLATGYQLNTRSSSETSKQVTAGAALSDSLRAAKIKNEQVAEYASVQRDFVLQKNDLSLSTYENRKKIDKQAIPQLDSLINVIDSMRFINQYLTDKITELYNDSIRISRREQAASSGTIAVSNRYILPLTCGGSLLFCFLAIYSIAHNNRRGLYSDLLAQEKQRTNEELNRERMEIIEDYKLRNEIKQKASVFQELSSTQPADDEIEKVLANLKDGDPVTSVITLVQLDIDRQNYAAALALVERAITTQQSRHGNDKDYIPDPRFYETKARILTLMLDIEGAKTASDKFVELNNEKKYRLNLTKTIGIDRMKLENLPFYGTLGWNFQPGVNILLGRNGYGKSHLIGLLIALLYDDKQKIKEWLPAKAVTAKAKLYLNSDHEINEKLVESLNAELKQLAEQKEILQQEFDSPQADTTVLNQEIEKIDYQLNEKLEKIDCERRRICGTSENITGNIGRVPILAIPDSRFIDKSETSIDNNNKTVSEDLKRDGATEYLYARSFAGIIKKGLFVVAQKNHTDFTREPYNLIQRVIHSLIVDDSMKKKMPGTDYFFKFERVDLVSTTGDFRFLVRSDGNDEPFELQKISQGTFSVLTICLMIYRFLSELHPHSSDVFKEKAIVLIDEIDAHLHPSWERKIVGILRREFPNVQFIITAHSPLVVASCLEHEVSVLRQNGDGGLEIKQFSQNFIGYSSAELLKAVFEVEDKDEHYMEYSAIENDQKKMEELNETIRKYESVESHSLTPAEAAALDQAYQKLGYIRSVSEKQKSQADKAILETELSSLRGENAILKKKLEEVEKRLEAVNANQ